MTKAMEEARAMPERIWITMEDHPASWAGSFRRWHASDLDHGDEYPQYVRADIHAALEAEVSRLTALLDEAKVMVGPFADTADHDIGDDEADEDIFHPMTNHNSAMKITVGHMRAARAFAEKAGA